MKPCSPAILSVPEFLDRPADPDGRWAAVGAMWGLRKLSDRVGSPVHPGFGQAFEALQHQLSRRTISRASRSSRGWRRTCRRR